MTPEDRANVIVDAIWYDVMTSRDEWLATIIAAIKAAENDMAERIADRLQEGTGESSFISCNWAANTARSLKHNETNP